MEHLIERSVLLAECNIIDEIHLPLPLSIINSDTEAILIVKTIEENERDHIINTLNGCSVKVYGRFGAAALLGVPVSTLNSKMRKLKIEKELPAYKTKI